MPSTYDTNGIVVREAAACGVASILIRDSCAAEGVVHERNGFLIDENAESLAQVVIKVINDVGLAKKMGDHAQNELYISWKDAVGKANDRYFSIIENYKKRTISRYRTRTLVK